MRHIIILFFFSSISLFAQETTSNHHLFFKTEIGGGYSLWQAQTPDGNFKGNGPNFNINLTPYYNYKNLILGISYGYERVQIDTLINTTNAFPYGTGFKNNYVSFNKVSLVIGYNIIRKEKITIGTTIRFGTYRLDKSFDNKLIKNKFITGAGLDLNYMIGDRIALFIEPNFEYKYYKLNKDLIGGQNINHRITSFNCSVGLNFKIL
jgi:hypothetical protein